MLTDDSIQQYELAAPLNENLESGLWTQSIIWDPRTPFRDFTQIVEPEEEAVPEERPSGTLCCNTSHFACLFPISTDAGRPKKRMRTDLQPKDRFNVSNDQYYEVSKDGGRHRVRQTFGTLVVEHAYPAQKLQLPFVRIPLMYSRKPGRSHAIISPSSRHVCQNKKPVPSTGLQYNFLPTSNYGSPKFALLRKRRIRQVVRLAKVVMWVKVCTGPAT